MALTLSGTNGVVGAGFTVDASGVSVTAGVGTFSSVRGTHHGDGANLTSLPAAQLTGTIADARFPATLPAASAANLFLAGLKGNLVIFFISFTIFLSKFFLVFIPVPTAVPPCAK